MFKKYLTIHDKNGKRFDLKISNEGSGESNRYFSISSQLGQEKFEPKNKLQQKLLDIWNTYHLNGMSAGTPEQNKELKKVGLGAADNFEKSCEYLKSIGLYEVEYKGKPYKYGSGWIYVDFPDNFEKDLFKLIDELQEEEDEYNSKLITIDDLYNKDFINYAWDSCQGKTEKLMAVCLHCGISWEGLSNVISSDGDYFIIEGLEYYVYTNDEANEAHRDSIEDLVDDIGFEAFYQGDYIDVKLNDNGSITVYKEINIEESERGGMLAKYDGVENTVDVNGTTYYLYRN